MSRKIKILIKILLISTFLIGSPSWANIKSEMIDYSLNKTQMQGYLAYDDSKKLPLPGVMIIHDWMGLSDYQKNKAQELAKLGYAAFAVDIYGKDKRPKDEQEAGDLVTQYFGDRNLLRQRIKAAYDKFTSMKEVDPNKIVVMGYCFGGTTALELARSGVPLAGTVSFHGILANPEPQNAKNIKGPVLILHGDEDPHVPPDQVMAFKEEMKNAGVELKFVTYKGAVHAFTNPQAGNDKSKGVAYDKEADKKSWTEFLKFLKQVFNK